jgi:hypothetical protein
MDKARKQRFLFNQLAQYNFLSQRIITLPTNFIVKFIYYIFPCIVYITVDCYSETKILVLINCPLFLPNPISASGIQIRFNYSDTLKAV